MTSTASQTSTTTAGATVRCAVIGLGMGRGHANGYVNADDAQLVAVADVNEDRLGAWADTVGQDHCFTDYKQMLRDAKPDLVSVALPNFLHAQVTTDALEAGAHVLCEKPMAMNLDEAQRMADAADRAKRKLGINLSFRANPAAQALKELASDGFLGEPYHAATQWTRRDGMPGFGGWFGQKDKSGGGPLIDLGVHRIDLALWLMGGPNVEAVSGITHHRVGPPRAEAQGKRFDVEDFATGIIRLEGGGSLVLEASWAGHQTQREVMRTAVTGTDGALVHRNDDRGYEFVGEYATQQHGHKLTGRIDQPRGDLLGPYAAMVRAVAQDTAPMADARDGLRIQRVLDGLYESARTGKEVRFD